MCIDAVLRLSTVRAVEVNIATEVTNTIYAVTFEGCKFCGRQVRKDFHDLIFTDHQVEYIVLP